VSLFQAFAFFALARLVLLQIALSIVDLCSQSLRRPLLIPRRT